MLDSSGEFMAMFERLAEATSPSAALRLISFFGGSSIYIPPRIPEGHPIHFVIGKVAAESLAREFGLQSLSIPSCDLTPVKRAGLVFMLTKKNLSATQIARVLGISVTRVGQIKKAISPILAPSNESRMDEVQV